MNVFSEVNVTLGDKLLVLLTSLHSWNTLDLHFSCTVSFNIPTGVYSWLFCYFRLWLVSNKVDSNPTLQMYTQTNTSTETENVKRTMNKQYW